MSNRHISSRSRSRSPKNRNRQLKSAIMSQPNTARWSECLPLILLSIRNTVEHLSVTPSQLVYGSTLVLPGELITPSKVPELTDQLSFANRLCQFMRKLQPQDTRHTTIKEQKHKELDTCKFVFVRIDAVRKPLQQPYEGPFRVLKRTDKIFTIDKHGKVENVSVDRVEVAFIKPSINAERMNNLMTDNENFRKFKQTNIPDSNSPLISTGSGRTIDKLKRFVHFAT